MILIGESPEPLLLIEQVSKITGETAGTVVTIAVREQLDPRDEAEAEAERLTPWLPATPTNRRANRIAE